jgi:putative transposase
LRSECKLKEWQLVKQDEAYTSKASFLDRSLLPLTVGETTDYWRPSGKIIKKGLYCSRDRFLINADINGTANIIRKCQLATDFSREGINLGLLTNFLRIKIFVDGSPKSDP